MPGFDPTILRDEEKVGGFEPETANDDTFFLEQLPAYPEPTPLANDTSVRESTIETPIEQEEPELLPTEEKIAPPRDEPKPTPPEIKEVGIPGEPLVLDNSLIDMLKDDLEKSKRKKEEQSRADSEGETVPDDGDTEPEFESYAAYAQHQAETAQTTEGEDVVVDLADIAADHPSTYGIERNNMQSETKETPPPLQTEKKRRMAWLFIGSGIAAVLALALIGYFYFIPHGTSVAHNADSTAAGRAHAHGQEHADSTAAGQAHVRGQEHTNTHEQEHTDSASANHEHEQGHGDVHGQEQGNSAVEEHGQEHANAHGQVNTDTHGQANTTTHEQKNADTHEKEETEHTETTHNTATPKKETTAAPVQKENHGTDKAETTVAHAVPHTTSRTKARSTTAKTKDENKPYKPQMPPPAYARGEYVIQVYASPSADDADEWLGQLRKRNITDGFITSQLVRGQTWYRVRFGKFSTREEAETKASQLGFSNIWIVRIR